MITKPGALLEQAPTKRESYDVRVTKITAQHRAAMEARQLSLSEKGNAPVTSEVKAKEDVS